MRDVILYVVLVINVVSMVGMVAGILMHSGRGGGLSDMFGGGGGAALGSSAAERNLTRITFVFALMWLFSVVALELPARSARRSAAASPDRPRIFGGPPRRSGGMADALA